MDLSRWLNSGGMAGFRLAYCLDAELLDTATHPMQAADPAQLRIVSGYPGSVNAGNNAVMVNVLPQDAVLQVMLSATPAAVIGSQFRLDVTAAARDCDGRIARLRECALVVVAAC